MFITRMSLSRRTFLRGMGAAVALPLLESMVPAMTATAQTAANPQRRFGVVFVPMGERPGYWTPKTVGPNFEFSPILKPLEPFRDHVTIVSDLCDPQDGHAQTVAAWLSGVIPKRTLAEDVRNGITIDQVIARQIGQDTVYPSLELATEDFTGYVGTCDTSYACAYVNTIVLGEPRRRRCRWRSTRASRSSGCSAAPAPARSARSGWRPTGASSTRSETM